MEVIFEDLMQNNMSYRKYKKLVKLCLKHLGMSKNEIRNYMKESKVEIFKEYCENWQG